MGKAGAKVNQGVTRLELMYINLYILSENRYHLFSEELN